MPFKMKLDQVRNILCSGQHDFVFSHNLASGVVHVAQSFHDAELTEVERLVLQVAQPTLLEGRGWNVDPELVALSRAKQAQVAFEPNVSSLSAADFNEDSFLKVANIGASTVEEAAHHFTCSDFGTGLNFEMSRDVLRQITGNSTLNTCSDLSDLWLCGKMASTQLRALCPQTCGCWEGDLSWAGAFSTTAFGCAGECLKHKSQTWERMVGSRFPCADTGPENFSSVTDYLPQNYQMWRKTAPHFTPPFRDFYIKYVQGLQEYVTGVAEVRAGVPGTVMMLGSFFLTHFSQQEVDGLIAHVLDGAFFEDLAAGNWNLLPGQPHPRGLTGCDYLTSVEVSLTVNVDLCAEGSGQPLVSIRPWCPVACGCVTGMQACPCG